ncbi:MAG TPA: glycosyltransferase family 4 protein, partial [Gallicola sp.]|nr:glycosyltransferase family 4 protein [Gallicola sp.]
DVKIITLGPVSSQVIERNPYFYKKILFTGLNFIYLKREFDSILKTIKPEIIHCFDTAVYNVCKLLLVRGNYKFVLNKCGGPNLRYFPQAENMILFSKENEIWFRNKSKFRKTNIYLIPNRVKAIKIKSENKILKDESFFNFVKIARIGSVYKKSIKDSINLVDKLLDETSNIKLYIIGQIINEKVYLELKEYAINSNVIFLTESKYTSEASKMLYLADAVIGTGRGIMEATSLSLPVLTSASNSNYPILINKNNFDDLFKANFSERAIVTDMTKSHNINNIVKLVKNKNYRNELSKYSLNLFDKYFNVSNVVYKYNDVYENAIKDTYRVSFWKDIILKLMTIRAYFLNR